jgi:phosphoribosylaminoimidazole-succinocarboxamide synthase
MTTIPAPEYTITEFPVFRRGKVRDMYDLGNAYLMVASDRISAFDVVLPTSVPGKGCILNQISIFWFQLLGMPNHMISWNVDDYPVELHKHRAYLQGRSMLIQKAQRFDVECVARGYVVGSGWKDYTATGMICGHTLPHGLQKCAKLAEPIFTPASKNDEGHDENIAFEQMFPITGEDYAAQLKNLTLDLYSRARDYAATKGIILADTKFEFGLIDGKICLIDEVLTPDSSRFWPADSYTPGRDQESYDKQYVRDWLETLDWDKTYPGPAVPADVVKNTLDKYKEIFVRLTGKEPLL